ncbi:TonB-dependent receptor [Granulicella sp. S156]|uniref:TonB-dependent receptor n=1 Tax=Granulicella sp. S156 TaxID=1747224 RepID=UPI00131AF2E2|nr:TonB-dependent receptor [Granulicella sp. S156]
MRLSTKRFLLYGLCAGALLASSASPVHAQESSAQITGTVTDASGAVLPNASALIVSQDTGTTRQVKTDKSGEFLAPALEPGHYRITIASPGFETFVTEGVVLSIGEKKGLSFRLTVGESKQTVTVSGDSELINTTSGEVSEVINQQAITELPINGRDPASLIFLSAGVTNVLQSPIGLAPGGTALPTEINASAGGGRQGSTFFLLDGSPNMDTYMPETAPFPNADATEQFRVSTNFDAQYGYAPGAVVSIKTRSGSNQFHGGLFEFIRNNDLNAKDYFAQTVDTLKRNQFGGYLGGPIVRDKLFFFTNYQGTRQHYAAQYNQQSTPTQAMLNGDFSAVGAALPAGQTLSTTPYTNKPNLFTTINGVPDQINPALFSPAAVKIATTALPLGQVAATGQVNFASPVLVQNYDEGTARLDFTLNDSQRFYLRSFTLWEEEPASSINGNLMAIQDAQQGRDYNVVLGHDWIINKSTVNEATVFWTEVYVTSYAEPKDINGNPVCMSKYIAVNEIPGHCYLEGLSTSGFGSGYNALQTENRHSYGLNDTLSKTIGLHTISVGGNIWKQFAQENADYPAAPIAGFSNYTGFGLADYLLGYLNNFTQGGGEIASVKGWQLGLFAQDEYRVLPNLTITAGLRWDPNLPPSTPGEGRGAAFRPGQQSQRFPNAPLGLVFPGDAGVNAALMPTSYGYFQPRVGFSWQPKSLPRTAIRGAFGMFTGPLPYSTYNHTADIAPFSPVYNLNAAPGAGYTIPFDSPWSTYATTNYASPFPPFATTGYKPPANSPFLLPVSVEAVFASNFRAIMTQSWDLAVDQQLSKDIALHIAYVGKESYHLGTILDRNPGIYSTNPALSGQRLTYPNFNQIEEETSLGTSPYQSLQIGLEKRMSHGFQARSNFTWSKVLDLSATGNIAVQGGLPNPFNIRYNRGVSQLNVPYVSTSYFVYTVPSLENWNAIGRNTLGGWEISAIINAYSGSPFGICGCGNGQNASGSDQYGDRADVVPGVPLHVHQGSQQNWLTHYINPAAFVTNALGTFGNSGRNPFITPTVNTTDAALMKNWTLKERYGVQFRWEMFNAFNHPSFGGPNTDPTSATFGQITSTGAIPPRVMQAALKLKF